MRAPNIQRAIAVELTSRSQENIYTGSRRLAAYRNRPGCGPSLSPRRRQSTEMSAARLCHAKNAEESRMLEQLYHVASRLLMDLLSRKQFGNWPLGLLNKSQVLELSFSPPFRFDVPSDSWNCKRSREVYTVLNHETRNQPRELRRWRSTLGGVLGDFRYADQIQSDSYQTCHLWH